MLGLVVNSYIDATDLEEYQVHRAKAATMDINDMAVQRAEFTITGEEGMPGMETDDDDVAPSANLDAIIQTFDVRPLQLVAPEPTEPQGTPGGYTGSSAGATQDVLPALVSGAEAFGTPGGCSTSVSPRPIVVPKMESVDLLDQRSRPSLDLFRTTRRRMKKTPYNELPEGAIIEVSDEDEGDMDIMVELGVDFDKNKRVKGENLSVAELNAEFERKVKEDLAAQQAENARKMAVIQEELRASNAKQDQMFQMMQAFFQAQLLATNPPQVPAPHPTPVGTPPPEFRAGTSHDAIAAAIEEDEGLRTRVRESSGPAFLTPPPSRVGVPAESSFSVVPRVVDREGDDPALHTDMVIVEDTQGSPNDSAGVQGMDESTPEEARHPGVPMEDVQIETLDLGGDDDDDVEVVQQTQASQSERAEEVVEAEAAPMDITNARSLIEEEGAARSSAAAPPPDDEVTHL